ncbi:hypothetical protein N7512_007536 [Penicillium capsulatum]|nr:hypothetical protein N7512_007536 [Penicillium capsulatum]
MVHVLSRKRVNQLRQELHGTQAIVITPDDENFPDLISQWSESAVKEAGAVVQVTSSHEVSLVVAFATSHYIHFVVRGGGHSTSAASSTHGGIVINLSQMRRVLVDPASATVAVGGGARWEDVDRATAREGLAVVGCTDSAVGVAGTALGGGFGWLTGRYGLVIDNLIQLKLVLANGRIVNASETEHSELFWALRGAGQCFGVVTELVFRAYPQRSPVFGGLLYLPAERLPSVVDFINEFDSRATGDEGLFIGFTTRPPDILSTVIVALLFYNGPRADAETFFAPLLALDVINNETRERPYAEFNSIIAHLAGSGSRKCVGGTAVCLPLKPSVVQEVYKDFDHIMRSYPRVEGSTAFFELLPYSRVAQVPFDATAYANRGPYHNVAVIIRWRDAELDVRMASLKEALLRKIRECGPIPMLPGHGVGVYANYTGLSTSIPIRRKLHY